MTAVYPIRFVPKKPSPVNTVEWMISNVCNYSCSYCAPHYHSGSERWLDFDTYKTTCDKIISESGDKKVSFRWTGGEPTLYPRFIELLQYVKARGHYNSIISNGSRTLRWWRDLYSADCVDLLYLTYHAEQTSDYDHIIDICNMFRDCNTLVIVGLTCPPQQYDRCVEAFNAIRDRTYAIINVMQINDSGGMSKYTQIQREFLVKNSAVVRPDPLYKKVVPPIVVGNMTLHYSDGTQHTDIVNYFIRTGQHNFKGWQCTAGQSLIRIEGTAVQRAVCGVGERWSITDPVLFKKDTIECSSSSCGCALDAMQPKYRNIEEQNHE